MGDIEVVGMECAFCFPDFFSQSMEQMGMGQARQILWRDFNVSLIVNDGGLLIRDASCQRLCMLSGFSLGWPRATQSVLLCVALGNPKYSSIVLVLSKPSVPVLRIAMASLDIALLPHMSHASQRYLKRKHHCVWASAWAAIHTQTSQAVAHFAVSHAAGVTRLHMKMLESLYWLAETK